MALNIYVNTGVNDVELNDSSGDFTLVAPASDFLIISNGSDEVADGEDIPTTSQRIQAGVRRTGSQIIVDKYFLADISENILKEIELMGNENTRYIFSCEFTDQTASEPVLEVWDNSNLNTIKNVMLGAGTPTSSWWRGITTTAGLPGVNWALTGTRLAGSSDGHFLLLNNGNGALVAADTLYANLCIIVPASAENVGFSSAPVIAIKWLEN